MRLYSLFIILMLSEVFVSCQGADRSNNTDCQNLYKDANSRLNEYYQYADPKKLDTALAVIEGNISVCPEYEARMVNLKIRLLILLKAHDHGYKFIDSLDEAKFDKSYKKNFYLKSFKAMEFESTGDSININKQYKEIVYDISEYLTKYPSDKEAIADLFFTKVKIENKQEVLRDLKLMQQKNDNIDRDFFDGLKTAVFEIETVSNAIQKK